MLLVVVGVTGQHSVAVSDAHVDALHVTNPFYHRLTPNESQVDELVARTASAAIDLQQRPPDGHDACALDISLAWTAKLGSSVYSTPMIVPATMTRGRAVWASTFIRYAEVIDGADGHETPGWPYAFSHSTMHTSPLAFDVDGDGTDEMLLVTFDGEAVFLGEHGLPVRGRGFKLPKLRVRKDWYVGLRDVHTTPFKRTKGGHALVEHDDPEASDLDYAGPDASAAGRAAAEDDAEAARFNGDIGAHGGLSAEAESSFGLFAAEAGDDDAELFEEDGALAAGAEDEDEDDAEPRLARWAALYEDEAAVQRADAEGYVYVDAHALSQPSLADVDGDGSLELVVAASYFIEEDSAARLTRHGIVIDRSMYVAGGLLVLEPATGAVRWSVQLDLTTELTKLRAYIYAPVTVADLDGDGTLEVAVGTSMGFLYVLSAASGELRDGFPVQMNEIQGQVAAADVDGDGALELLVVDAAGSVAAFRHDGTTLWEVQASGLSVAGVTLMAMRGDGAVQVVVATVAGVIHLFEGIDGAEVKAGGFPLRTGNRIMAAVLPLSLAPAPLAPPLLGRGSGVGGADPETHLVFTSFDGHLYVVNARSGCYDRIDIGEDSYTQVLADDLTGNGQIDLLVSTMNGNLYCFETDTPWEPLRSWRSQAQGRNGFQQREGFQGVVIRGGASGRHTPRALMGASFGLELELHDARRAPAHRTQRVVVRYSRGAGGVLLDRTYALPAGTRRLDVREQLPCPAQRTKGVLTVTMTNEHGQHFEDAILVSFHARFAQSLKYAALLPFAMTVIAVAAASLSARVPLPI